MGSLSKLEAGFKSQRIYCFDSGRFIALSPTTATPPYNRLDRRRRVFDPVPSRPVVPITGNSGEPNR